MWAHVVNTCPGRNLTPNEMKLPIKFKQHNLEMKSAKEVMLIYFTSNEDKVLLLRKTDF